jgi:hypothetical protein
VTEMDFAIEPSLDPADLPTNADGTHTAFTVE